MQVLREINAFPGGFLISGVLIFNVVVEWQLHAYKAPEPHGPHEIYFSASTSQLTYAVSASTASGSGVLLSGWPDIQKYLV